MGDVLRTHAHTHTHTHYCGRERRLRRPAYSVVTNKVNGSRVYVSVDLLFDGINEKIRRAGPSIKYANKMQICFAYMEHCITSDEKFAKCSSEIL